MLVGFAPSWAAARPGEATGESPTAALLARPLDRIPLSQLPHPAVARIIAEERGAESHGSGTLVDVRDDCGLVITNWHVIRDATGPITVRFSNGFSSPARVRKVDKDWDLAALVIWRPPVDPVPISQQAPRRGDLLTIAGYGSGAYRAATGRCVQYVAPGVKFPPEMVELSAEARQGDSGGPIFNERGELAGVLFGAARGTTTGSYCGRVRAFLENVVPAPGSAPASLPGAAALANQTPPMPTTATPPTSGFPAAAVAAPFMAAPLANGATPGSAPIPDPTAPQGLVPSATDAVPAAGATAANPAAFSNIPVDPGALEPGTQPAPRGEGWMSPTFPTRVGGVEPKAAGSSPTLEQLLALQGSPWDKAKTVLALIGLLSVVIQFGRLLGGSATN